MLLLSLLFCYFASLNYGKTMATITLREKPLKDGRLSLYLDIYDNGIRRYEFLKLYIHQNATNDKVKAENKRTRQLAEVIRGKRLVEAQNAVFGFTTKRDKALLLPTFDKFANARSTRTYKAIAYHLRAFCSENAKVAQIDSRWVKDFVRHLRKQGVSENSIAMYIAMFRVFWRWSAKRGIVQGDPFGDLEINNKKPTREYLTIDELQALVDTPTKFCVRESFLFSCFTGLRWSDVKALRWGDVEQYGERTRIRFRQQKTKIYEYMDLNAQAVALMGERKADDATIFKCGSHANATISLRKWVACAGIKKHITFHCARHTFATMLLTLDIDIYTVSKLLGHTDIKTTQIYAKIVDKKKQDAVDKIPKML